MANIEFDVWTAPDETIEALYPETQKLVLRLRRRQWYYRAVAYFPVLVWGAILTYALIVDYLRTDPPPWPDWIYLTCVAAYVGYTAFCLLGGGLVRRLVGYLLSALVALVGGVGSCFLGALLAFAVQGGGATASLVAAVYLALGVLGGLLSLLAMVHTLLLIIVSVRLRALTGAHQLRAWNVARKEVTAEAKAAFAQWRDKHKSDSVDTPGPSPWALPHAPVDPALPGPPPSDTTTAADDPAGPPAKTSAEPPPPPAGA